MRFIISCELAARSPQARDDCIARIQTLLRPLRGFMPVSITVGRRPGHLAQADGHPSWENRRVTPESSTRRGASSHGIERRGAAEWRAADLEPVSTSEISLRNSSLSGNRSASRIGQNQRAHQ